MAESVEPGPVAAPAKKAEAPNPAGTAARHEAFEGRPEVQAELDYRRILNNRPAVAAQRRAAQHLDRRAASGPRPIQSAAADRTGLPERLKAGVEALSGVSLDDVKVHYNSSKPAQLQALAYAQGKDIHLGPGQEANLPHEAWHVVQQAQGRVRPTRQTKAGGAVNDDRGLESEADRMGEKAFQLGSLSAVVPGTASAGHLATGAAIQLKKVIAGTHAVADRGSLDIDFEERTRGSSAGMYGVIAFRPDPESEEVTNEIELVQIASMRSNDEAAEEVRTAGTSQVKDMWRVGGKFHMDLLGSESTPRTSSQNAQVGMGYNSERRGTDNPLDDVTMSNNATVLNEYNVLHARDRNAPIANTTSRKIAQAAGFNKGDGEVRTTEMLDFPVSRDPVVASFHTTVDGDGVPWATVKWGFKSIKNGDEEAEIESVQGPDFVDGQSDEMKAAKTMFSKVMANSTSWTSPEAYAEVRRLLGSDQREDYDDGVKKLQWMAEALEETINKIRDASAPYLEEVARREEVRRVRKAFMKPHVDMLAAVLDELEREEFSDTDEFRNLVALHGEATELMG
jgi:hypothetical protein